MGRKQTQSKSQRSATADQAGHSCEQCCQHTGIAWGALEKCLHFEIGSAASRVQSELRTTDPHRLGKRNSPTQIALTAQRNTTPLETVLLTTCSINLACLDLKKKTKRNMAWGVARGFKGEIFKEWVRGCALHPIFGKQTRCKELLTGGKEAAACHPQFSRLPLSARTGSWCYWKPRGLDIIQMGRNTKGGPNSPVRRKRERCSQFLIQQSVWETHTHTAS